MKFPTHAAVIADVDVPKTNAFTEHPASGGILANPGIDVRPLRDLQVQIPKSCSTHAEMGIAVYDC
uniref:Uncharacterized protein n=1 Tax=Ralstonia solanacearum TaxID=305 RepID=A0A0S4TMA3_RALSL|nr:protein of unknown function [Ralstonia solanacearum]